MRTYRRSLWLMAVSVPFASASFFTRAAMAQAAAVDTPPAQATPLAIVPIEGAKLSGSLNVEAGKANIDTGGSVAAGAHPVTITLPHRGNLRLCSTSKVTLTADASIAPNLSAGEEPGLMMALDHGALEASFSTGQNSDVILTPDFRIVISGPGTASVQVRLGHNGDTCVDNRGPNAPYVSVSSVFDGGFYRVRQDQRVMFEGGSLGTVVDTEKESCGCPPETPDPTGNYNDFPLAQSEGLAPPPPPRPNATVPGVIGAQATAELSYSGNKPDESTASVKMAEKVLPPPPPVPAAHKSKPKRGFVSRLGNFFRNLFGG